MAEGAAAHEGDGGDLDLALVAPPPQLLAAQYVGEGFPDRSHVGIDLLGEIAGQEAEALAGLDRRPGDDQPVDRAGEEEARPVGHGQEGLAGAGRTEAEDQVVVVHRLQVLRLGDGLGGHGAPAADGEARGGGAGAGLVDGHAHVGLGHFQAGVGPGGQGLHGLPRAPAALGVAVEGDAAARCFDQHTEGILDQGRVTAARAGDGAHRGIGQGHELGRAAAQAGARSIWPARLLAGLAVMTTGTMRPIRRGGPSAWTGCR
jgi:hypothetical protein